MFIVYFQGQWQIKPRLAGLLASSEVYCQACRNMFGENASQWSGNITSLTNNWCCLHIFLKLPFRSQLINFFYKYYNKCFLWRNLWWVWKKNNTTLPVTCTCSTKNLKWLTSFKNIYFWWFQSMITSTFIVLVNAWNKCKPNARSNATSI